MTLQEIKHKFFGFRNGIVAKTFLDAGDPHKIIFGLQIPQIAEIGRLCGKDEALARQLWEDRDCRESRLLACRIFDPEKLSKSEMINMLKDIRTREEADYLAFSLLRHIPDAEKLADAIEVEIELPSLGLYAISALRRNLK